MRSLAVMTLVAGCFYEEASPLPADFGACTVADEDRAVPEPTWYRDVEPIVIAKCQGCHTEGGIAPFALAGHGQVSGLREIIRDAIETRRMPPWQPDPCCTEYAFDRSLSDAERDTVLRWLDGGLALGDPETAPPVMPPAPGLPRIDLQATMPAPFTPQAKIGADELRCFVLDHDPIDRTRYVTGFDFQPGVRALVHHVIVYAVEPGQLARIAARDGQDGRPGWDCYGDLGEIAGGSTFVAGWQPGVTARVLPDGIGRELKRGTRLVLNIHYDTSHGTAPDLSTMDFMLEDRVERVERTIPVANPLWFVGDGMAIPAGDPDAMVWFAYDPTELVTRGKPVEIHNVMLHMHELGSIGRVAVLRATGEVECLLNITQWDFHWMADYYFTQPVRIDRGDKVYVECRWDNSADNQKIVGGVRQEPRTLHWGTDQEMCGAVLTYSEAP
jgi:hypothetical protein